MDDNIILGIDELIPEDANLEDMDINLEGDGSEIDYGAALAGEFEIGDLAMDGDFDINLDGDELVLDSDDEEVLDDSVELLRSTADVSVDLVAYYQYALNALQKLFAVGNASAMQSMKPPITEFSYIADPSQRQRVYGFFCQMMDDLTTDKNYAHLTEEEAYQTMLDELYNDLFWTPNLYEGRFRQTFMGYYQNNKKLSQAQSANQANTVVGLLNVEDLRLSELVFRVNSVPFRTLTTFFSDPSNLQAPSEHVDNNLLGDFGVDLKQQLRVRYMTRLDLYNGIIRFLGSPDTLKMLGIGESAALELSTGELIRRFVLFELNDGTFYPAFLSQFSQAITFEDTLSVLARSLYSAMQQHSFAAEILFLCLELIRLSDVKDFYKPVVDGLAQYLAAFGQDKALVNPVFYTRLDRSESTNDAGVPMFKIIFTEDEQAKTTDVPGILCEVIGDNNSIYRIPLVYVGPGTHSAICPPKEVVNSVRSVTGTGRISINGDIRYRFTPSYSWLATLNITTSGKPDVVAVMDTALVQVSNPLLSTLMNYSNEFDTSGETPEVISLNGGGIKSLLGVDLKTGSDAGIAINQLLFEDGSTAAPGGMFVLDPEDSSIVIRYNDRASQSEEVIILKDGEYERTAIEHDADSAIVGVNPTEILQLPQQFMMTEGNPFLREIVKRLCTLTALDYEQGLEEARQAIVRDLGNILQTTCIDQLLGYRVLSEFRQFAKNNGETLNMFNLQTVKEIFDMIVGIPNALTDIERFVPEVLTAIDDLLAEKDADVEFLLGRLNSLDMHKLALQFVCKGELPKGDRRVYNALHCIPRIHAKLRLLEDQFVLVKILNEVGNEIVPIFMKNTAMSACYRALCTRETIGTVENNLATAMRAKGTPCLTITRSVLESAVPENTAILKYFVLERNSYGVLYTLEECMTGKDEELFRRSYNRLKEELGLSPETVVADLPEEEFQGRFAKRVVDSAFNRCYDDMLQLVYTGLIADVSHNIPLPVLKSFDMFSSFGQVMFNLSDSCIEDFSEMKDFEADFYSYIGSFLVSYSPISGEAEDDIDGGVDRVTAYLNHRVDFTLMRDIQLLEQYGLNDLRHVEGADTSDVLADDAGEEEDSTDVQG